MFITKHNFFPKLETWKTGLVYKNIIRNHLSIDKKEKIKYLYVDKSRKLDFLGLFKSYN